MGKFRITPREWIFVGIMVLLAIIFTNKYAIILLNKLNPLLGFIVYYIIIYGSLVILSYFGFIVFGVKIKNPMQIIGTGLVLFVFFLIFDLENAYVSYVLNVNVPQIYYASESGVTVWLWQHIFPLTSPIKSFFNWFFSFPVTVAVVSIIAVLFLRKKPQINGV